MWRQAFCLVNQTAAGKNYGVGTFLCNTMDRYLAVDSCHVVLMDLSVCVAGDNHNNKMARQMYQLVGEASCIASVQTGQQLRTV